MANFGKRSRTREPTRSSPTCVHGHTWKHIGFRDFVQDRSICAQILAGIGRHCCKYVWKVGWRHASSFACSEHGPHLVHGPGTHMVFQLLNISLSLSLSLFIPLSFSLALKKHYHPPPQKKKLSIYIYTYCRAENLSKNCPFLSWKSVQIFQFSYLFFKNSLLSAGKMW